MKIKITKQGRYTHVLFKNKNHEFGMSFSDKENLKKLGETLLHASDDIAQHYESLTNN